ncbi:tetratricopeptide repeat protein [Maridesulfovibrio sp.]|uniref:tetratricopeptide repeat protein n=1 Tax=Maridesulfovibrio sp. TaxID=2795000 RepID=UPI002A18D28E|nr:tetratricopeptide repeat protein [Maridesulfovibrio sp.]
MTAQKKPQKLSRRGFLFGGFRNQNDKEQAKSAAKPIAAKEVNLDVLAQANVAYENGRFEEAAEQYREFIKTEPQNADARKRLGHCLYKCGKYVQAKVEFERAIRILGKDNFSYLYLGLLLCRAGAGKKALRYGNSTSTRKIFPCKGKSTCKARS